MITEARSPIWPISRFLAKYPAGRPLGRQEIRTSGNLDRERPLACALPGKISGRPEILPGAPFSSYRGLADGPRRECRGAAAGDGQCVHGTVARAPRGARRGARCCCARAVRSRRGARCAARRCQRASRTVTAAAALRRDLLARARVVVCVCAVLLRTRRGGARRGAHCVTRRRQRASRAAAAAVRCCAATSWRGRGAVFCIFIMSRVQLIIGSCDTPLCTYRAVLNAAQK